MRLRIKSILPTNYFHVNRKILGAEPTYSRMHLIEKITAKRQLKENITNKWKPLTSAS